ncbi:PH domain-containing protein [Thermovibrio sp.]
MAEKVYKTDKLTFFSYGLLIVAYSLFLGLLLKKAGGFNFSMLIFGLFVLPVVAYFVFLLLKKVRITEEGIEVFGLTGRKFIRWDEVSSVSITPGRKYFIFIESKDGKLAVVDDSISDFKGVAREIEKRLRDKLPPNYDSVVSSHRRSYTSTLILIAASLFLIFVAIKSFLT